MRNFLLITLFILQCSAFFCQYDSPISLSNIYNGGNKPIKVDYDIDGDIDLLGDEGFLYLFDNDGHGNFSQNKLTSNWKPGSSKILMEDFNGDNYADVLVASLTSNDIILYYNDRNGGVINQTLVGDNCLNIKELKVCDISGDGEKDVCVLTSNSYELIVYECVGLNSFNQRLQVFDAPILTLFDYDNDQDIDILVGEPSDYHIKINNGSFIFNTSIDIHTSLTLSNLVTRDIDGDLDLDILSCPVGSVSILYNDNLQFTRENKYNFVVSGLIYSDLKDIDLDGLPDIVFYGNSMINNSGFLKNLGDGIFSEQYRFFQFPALFHDNSPVIGIDDFDGNGFKDLLTGSGVLYRAVDTVSFEEGVRVYKSGNYFKYVDVNSDNYKDLIYVTRQFGSAYLNIFVNNGFDQFADTNNYYEPILISGNPMNCAIEFIEVADIDNDQLKDIVCISTDLSTASYNIISYKNLGGGGFSLPNVIYHGVTFPDFKIIDFDHDNLLDLVFHERGTPGIYQNTFGFFWMKNEGDFHFHSEVNIETDYGSDFFKLVHFGNAVGPQVVYGENFLNGFQIVLKQNLDGNTLNPTVLLDSPTGRLGDVFLGDINNDGYTDLFLKIFENNNTTIKILFGTNTFEFIDSVNLSAIPFTKLIVEDINKDGMNDIVFISLYDKLAVYYQQMNGTFSNWQLIPSLIDFQLTDYFFSGPNRDLYLTGANPYEFLLKCKNKLGNRIEGNLFVDQNGNQQFENSDIAIAAHSVKVLPANQFFTSNSLGYFWGPIKQTGPNSITAPFIPYFEVVNGDSVVNVNVLENRDSTYNVQFAYEIDSVVNAVKTSLVGSFPRCNKIIDYWINIKNSGSTNPSGRIELHLDDSLQFISSSSIPDSIHGQIIYFHFENLNYFADKRILVKVKTPSYLSAGDLLKSKLVTTLFNSDHGVQTIYSEELDQKVVCAFDPNDKISIPAGLGENGFIAADIDHLDYVIRFQNTGTDTAENIIIKDQLDSHLDWKSLEVVSSSHGLEFTANEEGLVTFLFNRIFLPDSIVNENDSHGYVRYRVKLNANLAEGTKIYNSAKIFFDFNPAIVTNTKENTINYCVPLTFTKAFDSLCIGDTVFININNIDYAGNYSWKINGVVNQQNTFFNWHSDSVGVFNLLLNYTNSFCSVDTTIQLMIDKCGDEDSSSYTSLHKEIVVNQIDVFPVPTHDYLMIKLPEIGVYEISILDLTGQELLFAENSDRQNRKLDLRMILSGCYILRIYDKVNGESYNRKIIKQ